MRYNPQRIHEERDLSHEAAEVAESLVEEAKEEHPIQVTIREIRIQEANIESCRMRLEEEGCIYTCEPELEEGYWTASGYMPDTEGERTLDTQEIEHLTGDLLSTLAVLRGSLTELISELISGNDFKAPAGKASTGLEAAQEDCNPLTAYALRGIIELINRQINHRVSLLIRIAEETQGEEQVAELMQRYFAGGQVEAGQGVMGALAKELKKHPSPGIKSASIGSFEVRPLAATDAKGLGSSISCPSVDQRLVYYNRSSPGHMQTQRREDMLTPDSYMFGVYDRAGKAIGTFGLLPYDPGGQRNENGQKRLPDNWQSGVEIVTYLHESAQGQGLNTLLKQAQVEMAASLGYSDRLYSSVQDDNPRSVGSMDKHFPEAEKMKIIEVMPEYGTERAAYVYRMNSVSVPEDRKLPGSQLKTLGRLAVGYGRWLKSLRDSQ